MSFIQCNITNLGNDISFLYPCLAGRTPTGYTGDVDAPLRRQVVSERNIRIDGLETNSEIGTGKVSLLNNLLRHGLGCIHRDGKSQPLGNIATASIANDQSVDADHFTCQIDQWSAGIAMIDSCVGLDQILDLITVPGIDGSPCRADDTDGDRVLEVAERRPDSNDRFTGIQDIRISQGGHRWNFSTCFQDSDVRIRIRSNDGCFLLASIGEDDAYLFGSLDNMIVGKDISLVSDEETTSANHLIAGVAEEGRLSGDGPNDGYHCRADLLNRFCDRCFNIRVVESERLAGIGVIRR